MQHFKFVNWWIRGFVLWCQEQVKSHLSPLYVATDHQYPLINYSWIHLSICYVTDLRTNGHFFAYYVENTLRQRVIYQTTSNQKYIKTIHVFLRKVHLLGSTCWKKVSTRTQNCRQLALSNPKSTKGQDRWLRGDDIRSGSVCFDFHSTNIVQLNMLSKVA